jgi:hypothetical protein
MGYAGVLPQHMAAGFPNFRIKSIDRAGVGGLILTSGLAGSYCLTGSHGIPASPERENYPGITHFQPADGRVSVYQPKTDR